MRLNKVGAAQFQLAVDEEKQADMRLTRIAETSIDGQAAEKDLAVGPEKNPSSLTPHRPPARPPQSAADIENQSIRAP
jgi:hypothetical protein